MTHIEKVKQIRQTEGGSLLQLSKNMNISYSTMHDWISGKNPYVKTQRHKDMIDDYYNTLIMSYEQN